MVIANECLLMAPWCSHPPHRVWCVNFTVVQLCEQEVAYYHSSTAASFQSFADTAVDLFGQRTQVVTHLPT